MKQRDVTVIGAGIVGVSCALYLLRDGHRVTLVDRDEPGNGCSFGNAGMLEANAIIPVATPGLWRQVPGYLMDPLGPLALKWAHLPRLAPWLVRFMKQSSPRRARANAEAMAPLVANALKAFEPLVEASDAQSLIHDTGWLWAFRSRKTLQAMDWEQQVRRELGIEMEEVSGDRLAELAPQLAGDREFGIYFPSTRSCSDPHGLVRRFVDAFQREGGEMLTAEVTDIEPGKPHRLQVAGGDRLDGECLVLATGAWSGRICRWLGEPVPLNTERGYHCMLPSPGVELPVPVMFAEHKFVAHSMDHGLRLAGTIELGGMDQPPDWRRADILLHHARERLGDLNSEGMTRWMGLRPILPDSLPVIGSSSRHEGIFHAFGHQHLGLTLGPLTGMIIAAQVGGHEPPVPAAPYHIGRFRR